MIRFEVPGRPAPKGSARAINIRSRARLVASSSDANAKALKAWDRAVRTRVDELLGTLLLARTLEAPMSARWLHQALAELVDVDGAAPELATDDGRAFTGQQHEGVGLRA